MHLDGQLFLTNELAQIELLVTDVMLWYVI